MKAFLILQHIYKNNFNISDKIIFYLKVNEFCNSTYLLKAVPNYLLYGHMCLCTEKTEKDKYVTVHIMDLLSGHLYNIIILNKEQIMA